MSYRIINQSIENKRIEITSTGNSEFQSLVVEDGLNPTHLTTPRSTAFCLSGVELVFPDDWATYSSFVKLTSPSGSGGNYQQYALSINGVSYTIDGEYASEAEAIMALYSSSHAPSIDLVECLTGQGVYGDEVILINRTTGPLRVVLTSDNSNIDVVLGLANPDGLVWFIDPANRLRPTSTGYVPEVAHVVWTLSRPLSGGERVRLYSRNQFNGETTLLTENTSEYGEFRYTPEAGDNICILTILDDNTGIELVSTTLQLTLLAINVNVSNAKPLPFQGLSFTPEEITLYKDQIIILDYPSDQFATGWANFGQGASLPLGNNPPKFSFAYPWAGQFTIFMSTDNMYLLTIKSNIYVSSNGGYINVSTESLS